MWKSFIQFIVVIINFIKKIYLSPTNQVLCENSKIPKTNPKKHDPVSVNFHFTRKCNYECGFCFHTAKTSYLAPLESSKIGLKKLADAGMKKMNFSGGEPFLHSTHLGEMCKFCKVELGLESVSIVSNGSKIRRSFFEIYGKYVDILAVSVDSFDEMTNAKIGRGEAFLLHCIMHRSIMPFQKKTPETKFGSSFNIYILENWLQRIKYFR